MRIYLAARYSRRLELCGYRDHLSKMGFDVQARWLNGDHQLDDTGKPIGENGERIVESSDDGSTEVRNAALRHKFAMDDLEDVYNADLLINFTEPPRSGASRGGRHVEFGIALGMNTPVIVVGPRENIFHWLDRVPVFESWDTLIESETLTKYYVQEKTQTTQDAK